MLNAERSHLKFPRHVSAVAATSLLFSLAILACNSEESVSPDTFSPRTETVAPSPSTTPLRTPTPMPGDILLAAAKDIPSYPGSNAGGGVGEWGFDEFNYEAGLTFYTNAKAEDIFSFYEDELTVRGWEPERDPSYWSFDQPDGATVQVADWSFVKDDKRFLIGAQLNRPYLGEVAWALSVQAIWDPLRNGSPAPTPTGGVW